MENQSVPFVPYAPYQPIVPPNTPAQNIANACALGIVGGLITTPITPVFGCVTSALIQAVVESVSSSEAY